MSSLKAYLAQNYMSGAKADAILSRTAPPKKKRRKHADSAGPSGSTTSMIVDDDVAAWGKDVQDKEEEEDAPEFVEEVKNFRKKKSGGWQTIREPSPEDEQPQLVLPNGRPLQPSAPRRIRQKSPTPPPVLNPEQETVYRDASGRKIDLAVERAEKKRLAREQAEKEEKKMQWGKGLVQRDEEERKRRELEEEARKGWARGADDELMNRRMKDEDRWNDPAAAFLSKKKSSGPKKPVYSGPVPPPNRFGIPPGYRWDGVDRGNGFEKKLFQTQNERQRRGLEAYEWSVDDM